MHFLAALNNALAEEMFLGHIWPGTAGSRAHVCLATGVRELTRKPDNAIAEMEGEKGGWRTKKKAVIE